MKKRKTSRRSFWWTVFIVLILVGALDYGILYVIQKADTVLSPIITSAPDGDQISISVQAIKDFKPDFIMYGLPASFILFILLVLIIRLIARPAKIKTGKESRKSRKKAEKQKAAPVDDSDREKQLFLHIISILQREGRLIDFFAEELDEYDDAQIGAAVRGIHGTCRRVVEKKLSLQPVIPKMEGETVSVNAGFDPGAIKLVGNVVGEPPFTGTLKHRGWQAGKIDLPLFSEKRDPSILAPAEIEIE